MFGALLTKDAQMAGCPGFETTSSTLSVMSLVIISIPQIDTDVSPF